MKENRELYSDDSDEVGKALTDIEIKKRERVKQSPRDLAREAIVADFDFNYLSDELKLVATKSGVEPSKLNLLGPDNIFVLSGDGIPENQAGYYSITGNYIAASGKLLRNRAERDSLSENAELYWTIIHEEIHAISYSKIKQITNGSNTAIQLDSGYGSKLIMDRKKISDTFTLFDEGVTDKFALELLRKYSDTHKDQFAPTDSMRLSDESTLFGSYKLERALVEGLTMFISQSEGIPEEAVWNAMIANKVNGLGIWDPEIRAWFNEKLGAEFYKELKSLDSPQKCYELLNKIFGEYERQLLVKI